MRTVPAGLARPADDGLNTVSASGRQQVITGERGAVPRVDIKRASRHGREILRAREYASPSAHQLFLGAGRDVLAHPREASGRGTPSDSNSAKLRDGFADDTLGTRQQKMASAEP